MNLDVRMAKLEEKVENIKENLDDVVKNKLPSIERKLDAFAKFIYIGIGVAMAFQLVISWLMK
jgi:hypothetical protein